jgi:DHA2 family multidrug resistance protein
VHRAALVERISSGRPVTMDRINLLTGAFARHSADPVATQLQSFQVLDHIVNGQAMLLSFADIFFVVAIAFTASLPLLFLLSKGRGGAPVDAH